VATRYDIVILDSVPSTQDEAAARLAANARPVLVVTGSQTKGRGRTGRRWEQAERGVAASVAVIPEWDRDRWSLIPLATAVAVAGGIAEECGLVVGLKWPNDILLAAGKVGGILVEASGDVVTIGCGINLFWAHPAAGAAALFAEDPGPDLGPRLAEAWAERLLAILAAPAADWPRPEYVAASVTVGSPVVWEGGEGFARDIAADGALVVETARGTVSLHSGEVHLLR
jgi:BirA family transcriptional regulator, biotin operon repressor / biotin---[acetyl-CoA-carboxylase] ligase